jgi:hypothetical protein
MRNDETNFKSFKLQVTKRILISKVLNLFSLLRDDNNVKFYWSHYVGENIRNNNPPFDEIDNIDSIDLLRSYFNFLGKKFMTDTIHEMVVYIIEMCEWPDKSRFERNRAGDALTKRTKQEGARNVSVK